VLPRQTLDSYLFVFPLFGWPFLMFDSISFRVDCWKIKSHSTKRGVYTAHSYFVELTKYKNGAPSSEKHQRLPHTHPQPTTPAKSISDRRPQPSQNHWAMCGQTKTFCCIIHGLLHAQQPRLSWSMSPFSSASKLEKLLFWVLVCVGCEVRPLEPLASSTAGKPMLCGLTGLSLI
jgi:hypothetical protein